MHQLTFALLLLFSLPFITFGQTSRLSSSIKKDLSTYQKMVQQHELIKAYDVAQELILFDTILLIIASEIKDNTQGFEKKQKERIKTYFEKAQTNLFKLKEYQATSDSLFQKWAISNQTMFAKHETNSIQSYSQYKQLKKQLAVKNKLKKYQKSVEVLEGKRQNMVIDANSLGELFESKYWNNTLFADFTGYMNQAIYRIQKNRISTVEQKAALAQKNHQIQIDSLNNIVAYTIQQFEKNKGAATTQNLRIDSLSKILKNKNIESELLTQEIVKREQSLDSIQFDLSTKQREFNYFQKRLKELEDRSTIAGQENQQLENQSKQLFTNIAHLKKIGEERTSQNKQLRSNQLLLEQEKIETDSQLKALTGFSLIGVLLLTIAAGRLSWQNKKVTKSNSDLQRTKNLLQLKTEELNLSHRELNHRIKNNLQQIGSLIYLQEEEIEDEQALDAFNALQGRIDTIKIVHQKLYTQKQQQLTMVNMREYLTDLVKYIVGNEATLKLDFPDLSIEMDHATDIGLIVNELVTNARKYAFPKAISPQLFVQIKVVGEKLSLLIKDNGQGFPANFSIANNSSFGLSSIVEMFVYKSGKGTLHTYNDNGAVVEITMPFDLRTGKLVA